MECARVRIFQISFSPVPKVPRSSFLGRDESLHASVLRLDCFRGDALTPLANPVRDESLHASVLRPEGTVHERYDQIADG